MQIEHDPKEPPSDRTGNTVYWLNAAALVLLWAWMLSTQAPNWASIALGAWTGMFITVWAIAMTGNKVPRWMR